MVADPQEFRKRMACLADASRFRIVLALAGSRLCVSDLARSVGLSQSCTTRHLQSLARCGLVERRRDGRQVRFDLRRDEPEIRVVLEAAGVVSGGARNGEPAVTSARSLEPILDFAPSLASSAAGAPLEVAGLEPAVNELVTHEPADRASMDPARRTDLEDYLL